MVKESEFGGEPIWFSDAGSLDDPSWGSLPRAGTGRAGEIYVASAPPWCLLHPDLPHDEVYRGDSRPICR